MIVAVAFGNTAGDGPSVRIVDTDKCTKVWRKAILYEIANDATKGEHFGPADEPPMPVEWDSLIKACVNLPALVEATAFVYYSDRRQKS